MGKRSGAGDSVIFDEAAAWFALMRDGAATDKERIAFDDWRGADPRHAAAYEQTLSIWEDIGELDDVKALATAPEFGRPQRSLWRRIASSAAFGAGWRDKGRDAERRPRRAFAVAAACLALTALAVPATIYLRPTLAIPGLHATKPAETATIALPDGSAADLAPASKMRIAYSGSERRIILKSGEAFFDVRKGDDRAFVVVSGETEIRVTGTKFNVRHGPRGVTVAVAEGEVAVRRRASSTPADAAQVAELRLSAGEELAAATTGKELMRVAKAAPSSIGAWRSGRLIYRGAELREFIADANRYSQIRIIADDDRLLDLTFSASLRTDQIDATIDALPELLPLEVDRSTRDRIILRPAGASALTR